MKILSLKKISNFKTTRCIKNCILFDDKNKYSYWENKNTSFDEREILKYLKFKLNNKKKILHIGIGNSHLAQKINLFQSIDGITISQNEIDFANSLNVKNYNVYFLNKFKFNGLINLFKYKKFDFIIDANIKSYACCKDAFHKLLKDYKFLLNKKGSIITSYRGMKWYKILLPVFSFSFKKYFHKKLKEYPGNKSNIFSLDEAKNISKKLGLLFTINSRNQNIITFTKL